MAKNCTAIVRTDADRYQHFGVADRASFETYDMFAAAATIIFPYLAGAGMTSRISMLDCHSN